MRFSLEQLRAFTSSVSCGSFSAAARELGKGQSAISTAIANLELDLGVALFDRSRREPTLTDAGTALLPQAIALLAQARRFESHADAMNAGEEGRLTLAVEESLVGDGLDKVLVRFEAEFPDLELELLYPSRTEIIDLAVAGRVDIGLAITTFELADGYASAPYKEVLFIPAVSPSHPLASVDILNFEQMMEYRQLVLTGYQGGILPQEQISRKVWKVESQYGVIELVKRGLGWGHLPSHLAAPWIESGALVELDIAGEKSAFHRPVDLITGAHYREGRAGSWLRKALWELPYLV